MRPGRKGVFVRKGVGGFDEFLKHYAHYKKHECAIHFRASSAGVVDINNTHPFKVAENIWLMHNGTFQNITMPVPDRSDTWHFAQMLAAHARRNQGKLASAVYAKIAKSVEGQQKLLFLDDQRFLVMNPGEWIEDPTTGVIYSNSYSWDPPRHVLVHNFGEQCVAKWEKQERESKAKKAERLANVEAVRYVPFQTRGEYIAMWEELLQERMQEAETNQDLMSAARFYDRESELVNRDAAVDYEEPSKQELAESLELEGLEREDMRQLCCADPGIMAEAIYRTLRRL